MKELIEIQRELKAPKNQRNNFGKYNYRSCEDILEAVKPLCHKHNCVLTISDEMIMLGDRYYIKATSTITCDDRSFSVSAYAREALNQKGMADSQITGATSSYARKYSLNGLFCIDDTKDADTMDNSAPKQDKQKFEDYNKLATSQQKNRLKDYVAKLKESFPDVSSFIENEITEKLLYERAELLIKKASAKESK